MNVRKSYYELVFTLLCLPSFSHRICNSICPDKQFVPDLDRLIRNQKEEKAKKALKAQEVQALNLKYEFYPETRPVGWEPNALLESDECEEHEDAEGEFSVPSDHELPILPKRGRKRHQPDLGTVVKNAQVGNPALTQLFGSTITQKLRTTRDIMDRINTKLKATQKSSSGSRLQNGMLRQQINGSALLDGGNGPSKRALLEVTRRTAGMVNGTILAAANVLPARIQVRLLTQNSI